MRASREVVKVRPHTISFRGQAGDYGLLFFVNFGIFFAYIHTLFARSYPNNDDDDDCKKEGYYSINIEFITKSIIISSAGWYSPAVDQVVKF